MDAAKLIATWSKDPNRQVGCVVVNADHNQLSGGYNGFPRGVADNDRLLDRDTKLKIIVHAEANAVAASARNGHSLKDSIAYITSNPCAQCAALLIQAGIVKVVFIKVDRPRWVEEHKLALEILKEAGVEYEEFV